MIKATVRSTGEPINVYKLHNGNFYDYDGMGAKFPMSAPQSGKKEFKKDELVLMPT